MDLNFLCRHGCVTPNSDLFLYNVTDFQRSLSFSCQLGRSASPECHAVDTWGVLCAPYLCGYIGYSDEGADWVTRCSKLSDLLLGYSLSYWSGGGTVTPLRNISTVLTPDGCPNSDLSPCTVWQLQLALPLPLPLPLGCSGCCYYDSKSRAGCSAPWRAVRRRFVPICLLFHCVSPGCTSKQKIPKLINKSEAEEEEENCNIPLLQTRTASATCALTQLAEITERKYARNESGKWKTRNETSSSALRVTPHASKKEYHIL